MFFIWLSSTTIWHPQWRGFTCTTSLKRKWNLESPEEDLLICATWMFSGSMSLAACRMDLMFVRSEKNMVSCTMSKCSRSVYYYLYPSSPLPPALTTLLPSAAPISQAHAWRSGWAPRQMSASPWVVFWASSFFFLLIWQQKPRVTNLSSLMIHNNMEECAHYLHFLRSCCRVSCCKC